MLSVFVTSAVAIGLPLNWFIQGRDPKVSLVGIFTCSIVSLLTAILLLKGDREGVYLFILFILATCYALLVASIVDGTYLSHTGIILLVGIISVYFHFQSKKIISD